MKLIKVAAGVLNQTPLAWKQNAQRIIRSIQQAKQNQVSVLCLPELCISGYGCEDAFYAPGVHATALRMLKQIVPETSGIAVCVGLPLMYAGGVFNTTCLVVDQKIVGFVAKQHLAGDGIHYEQRWFKAWPKSIQGEVEIDDITYPLGDILFDIGDIRVGFEICEDAWVGTRPGASHAERGADIILNPSASHFAFGKHNVRRRFVIEGSRAFNVAYVYANLVGNESGRAIFDGDALIASAGELLACGQRLSFEEVMLTCCQIDVDKNRMVRARTGSFEPDLDGDESDIYSIDFEFPKLEATTNHQESDNWQSSDNLKCEEFTRAVSLGLWDYMLKSRSKGFIISLSGGADSTSAAVLVAAAFRLAANELGFDQLILRLTEAIHFENKPKDVSAVIAKLL
ncbi:MAG: nitrilase-related carbon-nitrogen hydrolase, partial [Planctomycetota bacterium]